MEEKIGLLPLGRATFDVDYANEKLASMLTALDDMHIHTIGPRELLCDADATRAAIDELKQQNIDRLLILQVTFTDAAMTLEAAASLPVPVALWAVPEPRLGGRLRLNAFCGLNLASHALGLQGKRFSWAYGDGPETDVAALLSGDHETTMLSATAIGSSASDEAKTLVAGLHDQRIARLGEHPEGFDTCRYNPDELDALAGIKVDEFAIDDLFELANSIGEDSLPELRKKLEGQFAGLDEVDQDELSRSLKLKLALEQMRADHNYQAFAIRCWPETFTEYGGAVCGPVSLLGEARTPCACEADVYGALSQMILQRVADAAVFLVDLVDIDTQDGTGVVWHCGQAPISMAEPDVQAQATIHTNRKMPLLFEFPLKEGDVTFMRISQAHGKTKMILSHGKMLKRDKAFTGTSGVVAFDTPAPKMLDNIMNSGLEHHMALAYGDHREMLRDVAVALKLPVLEL